MSAPDYAGLSRRYAARGDLRMAQLAAWAADVHTLEELLWENGLGQAPDPGAQLAAVGDSVAASIEQLAHTLPAGPLTARAVLDAAREAMVTTFDESVHGLLADRLGDLEHLDHTLPSAGETAHERTVDRLDGRSPTELAAELRTASADCATMASLLGAEGERAAAARLARQADAAAFEAYLVMAAVRGGDRALATVDLRWDLVAERAERDRFAGAVGSAEHPALQAVLASADAS